MSPPPPPEPTSLHITQPFYRLNKTSFVRAAKLQNQKTG